MKQREIHAAQRIWETPAHEPGLHKLKKTGETSVNDIHCLRSIRSTTSTTSCNNDNNNRISTCISSIKDTLSAYLNGKIHLTITREDEELQVNEA